MWADCLSVCGHSQGENKCTVHFVMTIMSCHIAGRHMTSHHDVILQIMSVRRSFRQKYWQGGHDAGGASTRMSTQTSYCNQQQNPYKKSGFFLTTLSGVLHTSPCQLLWKSIRQYIIYNPILIESFLRTRLQPYFHDKRNFLIDAMISNADILLGEKNTGIFKNYNPNILIHDNLFLVQIMGH